MTQFRNFRSFTGIICGIILPPNVSNTPTTPVISTILAIFLVLVSSPESSFIYSALVLVPYFNIRVVIIYTIYYRYFLHKSIMEQGLSPDVKQPSFNSDLSGK